MNLPENSKLDWRNGLRAVGRAWQGLVVYELLTSLLAAISLGPLLLTYAYKLIGFADEGGTGGAVLTNNDLFWFLVSPQGLLTLLLGGSVTFGLLLVEYSGLILLSGAALRAESLSIPALGLGILRAAPRLFGLAALQAGFVIVAALPFAVLAAGAYWLLLSDADINYFLAERPPRFWVAVIVGAFLAAGFACTAAWFFLRWAFAVPACVLDGQNWLAALRASAALTRGRRGRMILAIGCWEILKHAAFFALLFALDWANAAVLTRLDGRLSLLVGGTIALLLIDAAALQLAAAVFTIGLAGYIAYEYEQARRLESGSNIVASAVASTAQETLPARRARAAVIAIAILGPAASLAYALWLERQFVEHKAVMVTAHRGGPNAAPENSLAGLRLAIAAGADFAEIDVQPTADGHVVLQHDRDLRRMTGDVRDLTDVNLAELAPLRLRLQGEPTAERVPTLAQFIAACGDKHRLNIEMKNFGRSPTLATEVLRVLREQNFTDRAIVSCFQLPPLAELREAEPSLPVGAILSATKGDVTQLPVDFLSLNHRLVRGDLVRRAHERGMEVHVWTVNDRELALRLVDLGCDNLITSDPALMREIVDWHAGLGDASRMLLRLRRWMRE